MKERRISKLQVYATIKKPEAKIESYRDRLIYKRQFKSKTLEVVAKKEAGSIVVISAYMVK